MVIPKTPKYDLQKINTLDVLRYGSKKVFWDLQIIEYEYKDVLECLKELTLHNFKKTEDYYDEPSNDVYRLKKLITLSNEAIEPFWENLYIKLRLKDEEITIASFHKPI